MKRTEIKDIFTDTASFDGATVTICGWAKTLRDSKTFGFIELNDGSFFKNCQVVVSDTLENFQSVVKSSVGTAFVVEGTVLVTPENKQPFEIKATNVFIEGESTPDYPLQKKRHSLEFLREIAYLRPRTNTFSAVFRIRSECSFAIHKFFNERNFVNVHTPILTGADCEGAGEMFQVTTVDHKKADKDENGNLTHKDDFFGKPCSLTVSGQLNAETFALAYGKVYTFGPTFRAEKSNTTRHAAEFWMIEPEIAFADLEDDMELAEGLVKSVIKHLFATCAEELNFLNQFVDKGLIERLKNVSESEFGVCTYTEAVDILVSCGKKFEFQVKWGIDLQTEHERYLTEEHFKRPVFVIDYPKEIKAFYMRNNDDGKTVAAMDMLVPGIGELVGGSQREERLDVLKEKMKDFGIQEEDYWWYLNLRKFGGTKHAGFGLGFERLVMYVTGIGNIRDSIPFPRTTGQMDF